MGSRTGALLHRTGKPREDACVNTRGSCGYYVDAAAHNHIGASDKLEAGTTPVQKSPDEIPLRYVDDNIQVEDPAYFNTQMTRASTTESVPTSTVGLRQLPPALGGGCFNTSAEDAIIERWVEGMQDTKIWARGIRLLLLSFAENVVYITSVICSV